jgi:hypothetical protein
LSQTTTQTEPAATSRFEKLTAGLTPGSLFAGLLAMLLLSIVTHYAEVILGIAFPAEHSLALPALWVFMFMLLIVGVVKLVARVGLLTRQERLCVLYAMLIAAPLLTQGFWHRIIAIVATNPRAGDFEKMDAFNDKLWPHGPNVVEGLLSKEQADRLIFSGNYSWEQVEYEAGRQAELPVLKNAGRDEVSTIRIKVPLKEDGKRILQVGEPHMVSVLLRPHDLGPDTRYFARIYADETDEYVDVFSTNAPLKKTYLHKTGFIRIGQYGTKLPESTRDHIYFEIGLRGSGRLEVTDPKLFSVATLEGVFKGRELVTEDEYNARGENERAGLVVKPNNMWSWAGLKFILAGYIPISDWIVPMVVWTSFVMLILIAMLAIVAIMRRQWMDNERYPMPLARIPEVLADPTQNAGTAATIWRNKLVWMGFFIALAFVLMRAAHFYNPRFPDVSLGGVQVRLSDYISNPKFGGMFNTRLEINLIFLALCSFMELNILFSLVLGYWLFRSQLWVGEATKMNLDPRFPFPYEQTLSAYVTYALVVLFFTRRYLWRILKAAFINNREESAGELMSYRSTLLLLLATFVGMGIWASYLGIGIPGMLMFFLFLLIIGFVSAKFRAEAGLPWGYHAPGNFALFMTLLGGVTAFGPEAMLFAYTASFMLAPTVFFLIPGAQLEAVELGRRWNVRPSHMLATIMLAVIGGMVIGGWAFLSNAYALGGEQLRYTWAFDSKTWYFFSYNMQMAAATNQMQPATGQVQGGGVDAVWYAYGYAAAGTIIISVLRQMFAGFWFHPIGWVLGATANTGAILDYIWTSALAAWVIRGVVVWIGGGQTVRNKLQPFFIGVFLGAITAELLIGVHGMYLRSINVQTIFPVLAP